MIIGWYLIVIPCQLAIQIIIITLSFLWKFSIKDIQYFRQHELGITINGEDWNYNSKVKTLRYYKNPFDYLRKKESTFTRPD